MAIRIRVQPQYGATGGVGTNALTANRLYQQQLKNERNTNSMRLQYERQLWKERLQQTQLATQLQYGGYAGGMTPIATPYLMNPGLVGAGLIPQPGMGLGGLGLGLGQGQTNVTNQQAAGAANQSVSNSNTYHNYVMPMGSPFGMGFPFGGGFLGNLLGRWF